jgi:ATP-dependent protease ClpP protease subunit
MIYKFEAKSNGARLEIIGAIGEGGFTLTNFMKATESLTDGILTIVINSQGGDPIEAFAIHDYLKGLKVRSVGEVYGQASSAATIILAACDKKRIAENAKYLVHESSTIMQGKKSELKERAETLAQIDDQMLALYVKQTGKVAADLEALMIKDTYLSAQEALEWGFVDEIIDVQTKLNTMSKVKIAAQAEGTEEPKIELLEKLIEELKEELAAANAKLKAYEEDEEKKEEEEVEALKVEARKIGFINPKNESVWAEASKTMLAEAIKSYQTFKLPSVPKVEAVITHTAAATKESLFAAYKKGEIKTLAEYENKLKQLTNE